jgi:YgiT-type zinc finger domain-containing protein
MRFDSCEYCNGPVRPRRVTVDLRRGTKLCIFRNVPLGVCARCGERYYPGAVLEQLDEIARRGLQGATSIRVPTIDYREVG